MSLERSVFLGAQLLLLGLAAWFAAGAVSHVLARSLQPAPRVEIREVALATPREVRKARSHYRVITDNDIFNPPRPTNDRPVQPTRKVSTLKAKLLGTAPGQGMASYAIIEDETNRKQDLYRLGDHFQDRTISGIEWSHIVLKHGNQEELLHIEDISKGSSARRVPSQRSSTDEQGGIRALSETSFEIEQAEVDEAMENLNKLFTQIRAVPHFQDGEADGFRLFAIRRNSVFDKIGLKNGDIIQAVNGEELTDPARAMGLLQDLRGAGRVEVEVTRNREPVTLTYEIR